MCVRAQGHKIKNPRMQLRKHLDAIPARIRLVISGWAGLAGGRAAAAAAVGRGGKGGSSAFLPPLRALALVRALPQRLVAGSAWPGAGKLLSLCS